MRRRGTQSQGHIPTSSLDIRTFRDERCRHELRPYERLWSVETAAEGRRVLENGWQMASLPALKLEPPVAWDEICATNRSWHYHLHAWDALGLVLAAWESDRRPEQLQYVVGLAVDWLSAYPTIDGDSPFAWYDMAVGLRSYRLGFLLDAVARDDRWPDDIVSTLLDGVFLHVEALSDERTFARHSNHGFYQAAGLLAVATRFSSLPGSREATELATGRLDDLLRRHFSSEGVHREHSPYYHRVVLQGVQALVAADLPLDPWIEDLVRKAEEALAWLVRPDGRLVQFGDTDNLLVGPGPFPATSEAARFVETRGREGSPPSETIRAFPESGYVVIRDRWPEGERDFASCSYLAQTCAFHSRVHKHADDLSFVWYDRGRELLVDAGRFGYLGRLEPGSELRRLGYHYGDTRRVYVESTRAHNTVEIDDRSYARDAPYGSALRRWGSTDGVAFSETTLRHGNVLHERVLLVCPSEWLLVIDWLHDVTGAEHRFSQRFHFAPELGVATFDPGAVRVDLEAGESLWLLPLAGGELEGPVRGQEEPLLGWVSRKAFELLPAATVAVTEAAAGRAIFVTLLAFAEDRPQVDASAVTLDATGRRGSIAWTLGDTLRRVELDRHGPGFLLRYEPSVAG